MFQQMYQFIIVIKSLIFVKLLVIKVVCKIITATKQVLVVPVPVLHREDMLMLQIIHALLIFKVTVLVKKFAIVQLVTKVTHVFLHAMILALIIQVMAHVLLVVAKLKIIVYLLVKLKIISPQLKENVNV